VARGRTLLRVCAVLLAGQLLQVNAFGDCIINGSGATCALATNTFTAIPATNVSSLTYSWLITNDTAATVFLGNTNSASVQVLSATNGAFLLQCTVSAGTNSNSQTCSNNIVVNGPATSPPLADQIVCSHSDVVFQTAPDGSGPFSFIWRKDGVLLDGAATNPITITNVTSGDEGSYCVEITGPCNSITNCATLSLVPLPTIVCPSNLVLNCAQDVPPPDANSVSVTGATNTTFAGDLVTTNACGLSILRSYQAVNSCGEATNCTQVIVVANTNLPTITCASNLTVECGSAWDFAQPSAIDFCGSTNLGLFV